MWLISCHRNRMFCGRTWRCMTTFTLFLCPQRNFGRHIVIALSVLPSVSPSVSPSVPLSCPVHISYILWGRNSKFGVWIHLGMAECRVPFSGHCDLDLDLWPSFCNNRVRSISLILFEVGISNLVCGCILGWRSVAYHNWVTVTLNLTSDPVSWKMHWVWCISPIFFEIGIPNLVCKCILGWGVVTCQFWVTVTLTSDLVLRIIVPRAYLIYSLN